MVWKLDGLRANRTPTSTILQGKVEAVNITRKVSKTADG